jgi:hypothetical protein
MAKVFFKQYIKDFGEPSLIGIPYPGSRIGTHLPNQLFFQKNVVRQMLISANIP